MNYFKESKDLSWLGAPAFIIIVLLLVFSVNQSGRSSVKVSAEKIATTGMYAEASAGTVTSAW